VETSIIINQVFVLFLTIGVGAFARKAGIITAEVNKKLSELLLNIVSPFMIISSFSIGYSNEMLLNAAIVFFVAIIVHITSAIIVTFVFIKFKNEEKKVYRYAVVFSNCGFMGYPVLESLFGKNGIFLGSIYVVVFTIFIWTYGIMLFKGSKDLKTMSKALLNPGIISVLIGMVIFVLQIKLPVPVNKTFEMIGSMNTPIAMLIIGYLLAGVDFRNVFKGKGIYLAIAMKLVLIPAVVLLILRLFKLSGEALSVCTVLAAMPVAANTAIFAELYDADAPLASRCVAISTLLSIFTLPVVIMFL
jgi:predicted permease